MDEQKTQTSAQPEHIPLLLIARELWRKLGLILMFAATVAACGYIAATQWHPDFHKVGGNTLDDTPILMDFLSACTQARARQRPPPRSLPGQIRDRAARMLRQALLARGD